VTAAAVLYFPGTNIPPVLIHVHHGLHNEDPNQVESLASPHQMMAHGCLVDVVPTIHQTRQGTPGTQGMTSSGTDIPFTFDGVKLYMQHHEPTDSELNIMSAIDLTSSTEWKPWDIIKSKVDANQNLGVIITRRRKLHEVSIERWQENLGYAPRNVVLQTLARTTQLAPHISSDFNDVPQRHLALRLLMFHHRRIDETVASDWFHSDVQSTRQNKGFQVFTGKCMKIISVHCKPGKNHFVECLREFFTDF
jgi:hypothetical protein